MSQFLFTVNWLQLESKAKLTASQTVELKALRAQAEREEREAHHRRTYSK